MQSTKVSQPETKQKVFSVGSARDLNESLEIEMFSTTLELGFAKSFSENIGRLTACLNETDLYCTIINFLSSKVPIDLKVFGSILKYWVFCNLYATLIVTPKSDGL